MHDVAHAQLLHQYVLADVAEPVALGQRRQVVAALVHRRVAAVAEYDHVPEVAVAVAAHLADGVVVLLLLLLHALRALHHLVLLQLLHQPVALRRQLLRRLALRLAGHHRRQQPAQTPLVLHRRLEQRVLAGLQLALQLAAVDHAASALRHVRRVVNGTVRLLAQLTLFRGELVEVRHALLQVEPAPVAVTIAHAAQRGHVLRGVLRGSEELGAGAEQVLLRGRRG